MVSTAGPLRPEVGFQQGLTGDVAPMDFPRANQELRILGIPDGIDPVGGALLPIEITSHKGSYRLS